MTALHWAVYSHSEDAVAAILEHPQVAPNVADTRGVSPLDIAVLKSYLPAQARIADRLIAAGAPFTPGLAVQAAGSVNFAVLDTLIRHVRDFNLTDHRGIAPLHMMITTGWAEGTRRLLAAGADPTFPTRRQFKRHKIIYPRGSTAYDYARILGDAAIQAVLDEEI